MKLLAKVLITPALLIVASCGGKGDDTLADNASDATEAQADNLEDVADNTTNQVTEDALNNRADAVRQAGEDKAKAIDKSDIDTSVMTDAQKEAVVNKM